MFIAADINKRALKRKQGQLQFTQLIKSNFLTSTTAKLKAMESEAAKKDKASGQAGYTGYTDGLASNYQYLGLQAMQTEYDLAVESAESQLKLIDAQISSLDKLVQNNISQDNTLWCVGGGS